MPATTFHWIRVQTFCYATERKELLEEVMEELLGEAEYSEEPTESEHGNIMTILEARLTKQRQYRDLFLALGPEIRSWIVDDIGNVRIKVTAVKGRRATECEFEVLPQEEPSDPEE